MWCLTLITYLSFAVQISFITVAIAAGLYYLAELVEEYTVLSKKIIWWMNLVTLILYILLWLFEDFPLLLVTCGLLAQVSHFIILIDFPYVCFSSPSFLISIAFIFINHYLAFQYFGNVLYLFSEIMAYFTLCLWLVPFAMFVSLSANDNVLPTITEKSGGDIVSNYFSKKEKTYGLLRLFNYAKETILPYRSKKGY